MKDIMNTQNVFMETVMPSVKFRVYITYTHYCPHIHTEIVHNFFLVPQSYKNNVTNSFMRQLFTEHLLCFSPCNNFNRGLDTYKYNYVLKSQT